MSKRGVRPGDVYYCAAGAGYREHIFMIIDVDQDEDEQVSGNYPWGNAVIICSFVKENNEYWQPTNVQDADIDIILDEVDKNISQLIGSVDE